MSIALITPRAEEMATFIQALEQGAGLEVRLYETGEAAINAAGGLQLALAVVDEGLPDMSPLEVVVGLMRVSAMTNTAVISSMEDATFHDASEGLGILMHLSPLPTAEDADVLIKLLIKIRSM